MLFNLRFSLHCDTWSHSAKKVHTGSPRFWQTVSWVSPDQYRVLGFFVGGDSQMFLFAAPCWFDLGYSLHVCLAEFPIFFYVNGLQIVGSILVVV